MGSGVAADSGGNNLASRPAACPGNSPSVRRRGALRRPRPCLASSESGPRGPRAIAGARWDGKDGGGPRRPDPGHIGVEELELVSGLRQRSEEAVTVFLERYRPLFYHCIAPFEADHAAREDLYQDLVVYVLDRLDRDSFDPERGSFGTWLYRVAWCRCVDLKRKQAARRTLRVATVGEHVPDQVDDQPGPVEQVEDSEIGGMVRDALGTLENDDRRLLDLRFVQGATLGEISDCMSISLEQTKYRLRRATVSLRRVLLNHMAVERSVEG